MFSYCHLEVGKNESVITVRLGKHRVLDELTVNEIGDELLGVADRLDCSSSPLGFLRRSPTIECDAGCDGETPQENGVQRGKAQAMWR